MLTAITPQERFLSSIDKALGLGPEGACWLWTGSKEKKGYGYLHIGRRNVAAHRFSYEYHKGKAPGEMQVMHECDTPACVNPAHLKLGTNQDNIADMIAKGRGSNQRKTHCKRGHEFTPENTLQIKEGRSCRTCAAMHIRNYRALNPRRKHNV